MSDVRNALHQTDGITNDSNQTSIVSWSDFAAKTSHSLHFQQCPHIVCFMPFEEQTELELISTQLLTDDYHRQLTDLLRGEDKRLGFITESQIVLRLQTTLESPNGSLLVTPLSRFYELVNRQFSKNPLTRAEKNTLLQIVCGYSLKDAAQTDGISYETKRVQAKSILKKSSMKRQVEVSNYFLAQLLMDSNLQNRIDSTFNTHQSFAHYVESYLPESVRPHTILGQFSDPSQRAKMKQDSTPKLRSCYHRYLEMGPSDGTPYLMLHGQILPYLSPAIIHLLNSLNMRLIWPLRNGTLGPADTKLGFQQHVQHTASSIELAREMFCDQFAGIVAIGCSAHYSIAYAEQFPDATEDYFFIGTNSNQARKLVPANTADIETTSQNSYDALRTNYFLSMTCNPIIDRSHLRKLLLDAYSSSPADINAIHNEFLDPKRTEALMYQFSCSAQSIDYDCSFHATPEWMLAKAIKNRIHIIQGEADGIHDITRVKQLANSVNATFRTVENAGQIIFHSHTKQCLIMLHEASKKSHTNRRTIKH